MRLEPFRRFWIQRLDALATELRRGRPERHGQRDNPAGDPPADRRPPITSEDDT